MSDRPPQSQPSDFSIAPPSPSQPGFHYGQAQSPSNQQQFTNPLSITFQNLNPQTHQLQQLQAAVPSSLAQQSLPGQNISGQNLPPITPQMLQSASPQHPTWLQRPPTTPEYRSHADRLIYVNYYLRNQPNFFTQEELNTHLRYEWFRKLSYFEIGVYLGLLIIGRNPPVKADQLSQTGGKLIFGAGRQKFVFLRMFFLNLGLATHLMAVYRESHLRNTLAEKYFSQVQYGVNGQPNNQIPQMPQVGNLPQNNPAVNLKPGSVY